MSGIGKRKSTLQKQIEQLSHFLEKAKEYNQKIYRCEECTDCPVKSSTPTSCDDDMDRGNAPRHIVLPLL